MALSEMSQRRPDYSEKLASTVLTQSPSNRLQPAGIHAGAERKGGPETRRPNLAPRASEDSAPETQKPPDWRLP